MKSNNTDSLKSIIAMTRDIKKHETALAEIGQVEERVYVTDAEASALQAQMIALSTQRTEVRAIALIENKPADTGVLDEEEQKLERALRRAAEDAASAQMALGMLNAERGAIQAEIVDLQARQHAAAIEHLIAEREAALDVYVVALEGLGPLIARALACDRAIFKLDPNHRGASGKWLYDAVRKAGALPIPLNRCEVRRFERPATPGGLGGAEESVISPLEWLRYNPAFGDAELVALTEALAAVGVDIAPSPLKAPASPTQPEVIDPAPANMAALSASDDAAEGDSSDSGGPES